MENTMINRIIPLIILLIAGCAPAFTHTTSFILDTNPQGATVICGGQDKGYAPTYFTRWENIDFIGENRAYTEKEIAKFMEIAKINRGELKLGENIALTDEEALNSISRAEALKIIHGELEVGENTFFPDEEVKIIIEAQKILDGESTLGEYTDSIDADTMQTAIQLVKDVTGDNRPTCTAHWSSGVSKKYPSSVPYTYIGNGTLTYTLQRPEGAGYSQDAEFALKIKQLQQSQQTAELNALIAIRSAEAQERSARAQERQNTKSTTCYTNLGITTCY